MAILIPTFELANQIGQRVEIEAATINELIEVGTSRYGAAFAKAVKSATIAVNGRSVRLLKGGRTPLVADDTVWLVMPSGGG